MCGCLKKKAFYAMFSETGEKQPEAPPADAANISCLQLFNALNAQSILSKVQDKSLMHVEATINGKRAQALIDMGASHNFIKVDEAKRLGFKVKKSDG